MSLLIEVKEEIELIEELFPICRSITGNGVRETLDILSKYVPIEIYEVKSGTKVFDWTVPKEWDVKEAYMFWGLVASFIIGFPLFLYGFMFGGGGTMIALGAILTVGASGGITWYGRKV